ncbi:MAG: acyl-ACP--UDP-N-acetylglucosamine O-acyltransferase [Deltaproteobacteria bacterium]|nr:MAG: acyl-ACP--UDP-N-acetylglucosamine O-acyltransferase [Deltaproteobacteria bacterium]
MAVHPTAVVDPQAHLGHGVHVGPFAVIGPEVSLADGVQVGPHCVVQGRTSVGAGTVLTAHVCLGGPPQDRAHDGAPTRLMIGEHNVFREFVTVHAGSSSGRGETRVGAKGYFMANSHIAHDAWVGDGVMLANSAAIAGHCDVGDGAVLGGLAGVHQHVRIGRLAMVGAGAMCSQDVPPFTIAQGDRARLFGLNIVGLRRAGLEPDAVRALKDAWRLVFTSGLAMRAGMHQAREAVGSMPEVEELLTFLDGAPRGVCRAASVRVG